MIKNQFFELAIAAVKAGRRRLAGELFSMPVYRSLVLRFPTTEPPQIDLPRLVKADPLNGEFLAQGRFFLAGVLLNFDDVKELWSQPVPSRRFAARLHEFGWIHDLLALDTAETKTLAGSHVDHWIQIYGVWNPFSWTPGLAARRCLNWLSIGTVLFGEGEKGDARRANLIKQISYLHSLGDIAADTQDRLQIALALTATGILIPGAGHFLERGMELLAVQLGEQILPDGGHISRKPEMAASTLYDLVALKLLFEYQDTTVPEYLEQTLARLAPMVRFMCAADGNLVAFNGGGEGRSLTTKQILKELSIPESAFSYAPHSGYQRVKTSASLLIMDTGRPPPEAFSQSAHAGALAIELSTSVGRIIVNCGWSEDQPDQWHLAVRTTAAHSTLTINDTSSAQISSDGFRTALLGPRLRQRGLANPSRRTQDPGLGTRLEASHGGYLSRYGVIHQRQVLVSENGDLITGQDQVFRPRDAPKTTGPQSLDCTLRFHLHPKVRASIVRDGSQVLLVLPNGAGWRFQSDNNTIELQPSVYLAAGAPPQRTSQIVVQRTLDARADAADQHNFIHWSIEKV